MLLNLKEYDLITFEFLIINEAFNNQKYIDIQNYLSIPEYVNILVDRMEVKIVRGSLKKQITYIKNNTSVFDNINNRVVFHLNSSHNKKLCYYLLEYLLACNIKYKNIKLVIDVYISSMYAIPRCDELIRFYYKNLSDSEK